MKGVPKLVVALFLAALLAVGISACGGDDDSTATTSATTTSAAPADDGAATDGGGTGTPAAKGVDGGGTAAHGPDQAAGSDGGTGHGAGKPAGSGDSSGSSGSAVKSAPLRVSGGGSAPFRVAGGDNSIQSYGSEGDESELAAAAEALHSFLVARAGEDWATACSYFSQAMVKQLEQLASQSAQLKDKGCPPILNALTASVPSSTRTAMTEVDAASLRYDDEHAFLLYHGADGIDYFMPMVEEGGAWKVAALAATPLQ